MNRKERRASAKRNKASPPATQTNDGGKTATATDLIGAARRHYQLSQHAQAETICHQILAREPSHVDSLNLLGLIAQGAGLHKRAINFFAKAVLSEETNAACHYNIATSYLALNRRNEAGAHYRKSISLGMSDKDIEHFIVQNPAIAACMERSAKSWPLLLQKDALFGATGLEPIANDIFFQSALAAVTVRGLWLETIMTQIRGVLLSTAAAATAGGDTAGETLGLFCALAQQCFNNEYIFAQSDEETLSATQLRSRLLEDVAAGVDIPPVRLAAVAAYFPLYSLPIAEALLTRDWPEAMNRLLRQQIGEPLEERRDRDVIPTLTPIKNVTSLEVMNQYNENPYPRWTVGSFAIQTKKHGRSGEERHAGMEILIAGCGTGRHAILTARSFPDAKILAVELSLASLAYARRKTREAGVHGIAYAQADILELGNIGRDFDRIECMGVLHHLADPKAGWQVLLSLLRPNGEMAVGLYSETARRSIVGARALIAERGYRATDEDIRRFRQEIFRVADKCGWSNLTMTADFYSMSGCRDLLFNVMEHRYTLTQIKTLLSELDLSFAGFELDPAVVEKFQRQFPGDAALVNLDHWAAFEAANPDTFRNMYQFFVRKN